MPSVKAKSVLAPSNEEGIWGLPSLMSFCNDVVQIRQDVIHLWLSIAWTARLVLCPF
jgi:hypothetical protein